MVETDGCVSTVWRETRWRTVIQFWRVFFFFIGLWIGIGTKLFFLVTVWFWVEVDNDEITRGALSHHLPFELFCFKLIRFQFLIIQIKPTIISLKAVDLILQTPDCNADSHLYFASNNSSWPPIKAEPRTPNVGDRGSPRVILYLDRRTASDPGSPVVFLEQTQNGSCNEYLVYQSHTGLYRQPNT